MTQALEKENPLELARTIGYELYGDIGKTAFEELELCYASKLSPKLTLLGKMRSFTNLNFYWARGYFKNSTIDEFHQCLPDTFRHRNGTSGTLETMFGSITQGGDKLIQPLFHGYEMCFMPELMAFLGTKEGLKEKVNVFNEVLEGNLTCRDLLKFGNATDDLIKEYENGLNGLFFDGRTLKYYPNTCFVVGTRPLDNETYTYLETSGFWSRFHTIQFRITDKMSKDIFTGSYCTKQEVNVEELKGKLKKFNNTLNQHHAEISAEPPNYEEIMKPVLQEAVKFGEAILERNPIIDNSAIFNARIKGDIIRETKAFQILYPEASNLTVKNWTLGRLAHFFDFTADPIIASVKTLVPLKTLQGCFEEILILVKEKPMKRGEIQDTLQPKGYTRITIDRALDEIKKKELNKSKEYGFFQT